MPTITFTLSDANLTKLVDAICGLYHYKEGAETRSAFTKRIIIKNLKAETKRWEREQAEKAIQVNEISIQ